ncbi:uncharacterized protein HMPREF1541_05280 [Cyphellophora europaea CBS 101466]|uniref:Uncharacterized protein n=1 Tax=Cyphellophora europaea (strain CBS 101466) TaxID=1220924 RepID=W2RTJ0_CYPE1|nr:uncharacterized protein HMPREF1541_05280 [Cyphellophora europaea CBS 101466]ETN39058.1 hypothetical protein HMPREF1541_05280 [Cyphellophora europaea CBS 101466]
MASKIFEMIPFLRAPLLVNSSIGLILSAVDTAQLEGDWWYNDGHLFDTMSATVAFYAASLVTTALFTYTDHRRGGLKLTGGRIVVPTNLVKAAVDLSLGIALLVLHIVVCVRLGSSGRDVVLHMYAGFGALTAGYVKVRG